MNKKLRPSFTHNDMHLRKEAVMSIIETNSKVYEPKSYDKAIANPIYGTRWRQAIEKEIHNLKIHHTWEYEELPEGRKTIRCKWVFRVKYNFNGSVERFKVCLVA